MKQCTKCKEWKDESEFNKNARAKDGLTHKCKACLKKYRDEHKERMREYCKQYYANHREEILKNVKRNTDDNIIKRKTYEDELYRRRVEFIDSLKTPCEKCGESRNWVIEFHHKDPSAKSFNIGNQHSKKESDVLEEVKKCVCLCANCHTEFHYIYGIQPENPIEALEEYLGDKYV